MADSVTNVTATWSNGVGIQLNWTAPADVTTGSSYIVYILTLANTQFPVWQEIATIKPGFVFDKNTSTYSASNPITSYFFPWYSYVALQNQSLVSSSVQSLSFTVSHLNENDVESASTNVTVYSQSSLTTAFPNYAPQHLPNEIDFNSDGSFVTVPQNSYEEIAECVSMYFGTQIGQRTAVPGYGVEDLAFTQINLPALQFGISNWEPRANATLSVKYSDNNQALLNIQLNTNAGNS
jgi:uncharacterized membrane protein YcgQ (UPF0703/DUF1980 family)